MNLLFEPVVLFRDFGKEQLRLSLNIGLVLILELPEVDAGEQVFGNLTQRNAESHFGGKGLLKNDAVEDLVGLLPLLVQNFPSPLLLQDVAELQLVELLLRLRFLTRTAARLALNSTASGLRLMA